jgi:hypothetical protein
MARAYRYGAVVEGIGTTEGRRSRVARGRPNWWVILAVTLALMALLVATAGNPGRHSPRGTHALTDAPTGGGGGGRKSGPSAASTTTSTSVVPATDVPHTPATSLVSSSHSGAGGGTPTTVPASVPTTTVPTTTTTTAPGASQPSDRTQSEGVIEPPAQRSSGFDFTGTGAMTVSVVWSGATYLTMQVSCPNGSQNVGGTAAMGVTLPDASGSCTATVTEPTSESTALTFTITIGPAGG